jgi:hypothetical protein
MRTTTLIVTVGLVVTLAGCSSTSDSNGAATPTTAAAATPAATTAAATIEAKAADAKAIIEQLETAKLGLVNVAVQNEDTDPNNLIGRPNGYTSRASADLPGGDTDADKYDTARGLVVEVFADAAAAKARADYIAGLQKSSPILGTEYHYFTKDGAGLVRVSGKIKPTAAKKVEAALANL